MSVCSPRGLRAQQTCAVLGGKNSKEKVGFPSALACSSFWEMCMAAIDENKKTSKKERTERGHGHNVSLKCCSCVSRVGQYHGSLPASDVQGCCRCIVCTPRVVNSRLHALSEITFASPAISEYPRHILQLLPCRLKMLEWFARSSMTVTCFV
jgi:hypothetical protein